MNFTEALEAINVGETVMRGKWSGKAKVYLVENKLNNINHVEVRTLGSCIMYAASSEDLLANDWELVNKEVAPQQPQLNPDEIVL
jgi:hypothetical protein